MANKRTITIYGSGCKKCQALEKNSRAAVDELGIDADVDHVTDIVEISAAGIMSTPALAIDGQVVSMGKVLDTKVIKTLLG
ncbi:MAG: thioredoxin family protein [Eggerthellaceae bacterium]|jgi:small redox-active disulfide protein 2|nr:thioredoxin family protein [Eggerthellaceae bacterium]